MVRLISWGAFRKVVTAKALGAAAVIVLLIYISLWLTADKVRVEHWKISDELEIELLADAGWEATRGIYYQVYQQGRTVVPITFIYGVDQPYDLRKRYTLARAAGCPVVAILDARAPAVVLAVLDTQTMDSWPHRGNTEHWRDASARGRKLVDRLNAMTRPPSHYRLEGE